MQEFNIKYNNQEVEYKVKIDGQLIANTPNDAELGQIVRQMFFDMVNTTVNKKENESSLRSGL